MTDTEKIRIMRYAASLHPDLTFRAPTAPPDELCGQSGQIAWQYDYLFDCELEDLPKYMRVYPYSADADLWADMILMARLDLGV